MYKKIITKTVVGITLSLPLLWWGFSSITFADQMIYENPLLSQKNIIDALGTPKIPAIKPMEKETSLLEQNISKLFLFSKDKNNLINKLSEKEKQELQNKEIRKVLYKVGNAFTTYVSVDHLNETSKVRIVYKGGTTEDKMVTYKEGELFLASYSEPIVSFGSTNQLATQLMDTLDQRLSTVTMDELLKPYGGKLSFAEAFNSPNTVLGEVQIGNKRDIDPVNLSETLTDIQRNSKKTAEKIISLFPEWSMIDSYSDVEKKDIQSNFTKSIDSYIMAYLYMNRWFNFKIDETPAWELMFGGQSLFSDDTGKSDLELLDNFIKVMNFDPWPNVPGSPLIFNFLGASLFFDSTYGVQKQTLGFNISELQSGSPGQKVTHMIEYMIRTIKQTTDYSTWFKSLGFNIVEDYSVDIPNAKRNIWQAIVAMSGDKFNAITISGFALPVLLSVHKPEDILIVNTPCILQFSGVNKNGAANELSPQKRGELFATRANALLKFLIGTKMTTQEKLGEKFKEHPLSVFNSGEFEGYRQKDMYNPENTYLHDFILNLSPSIASTETDPRENASSTPRFQVFSLGNMETKYTIAHEMNHAFGGQFVTDDVWRVNGEQPAVVGEDNSYGNDMYAINWMYADETNNLYWNNKIPETEEQLKNYAHNTLDLSYMWDVEKARQIFSLPLSQRYGKIYQMRYFNTEKTSGTEAVKLSNEEVQALSIDPQKKDFIKKLFDNKIILPQNETKDKFTISTNGQPYTRIPFKRDSYFVSAYTGAPGTEILKYKTDVLTGWENFWDFEATGQFGTNGYKDVYRKNSESNEDKEVYEKIFKTKDLENYLVQRHQEAFDSIINNQLVNNITYENLVESVQESINNPNSKPKINWIGQYILQNNDLFDSIKKTDVVGEIVTSSDLDNQGWLIDEINRQLAPKKIGKDVTKNDLSKITSINLDNQQIKGTIPQNISWLSQLEKLSICRNQITGKLPRFAPSLTHLDVSKTKIYGVIPDDLFNLVKGNFSHTQLTYKNNVDVIKYPNLDFTNTFVKDYKLYAKNSVKTKGKLFKPFDPKSETFIDLRMTSPEELYPDHVYEILDSTSGKIVYHGKANPTVELPINKQEQEFILRMENVEDNKNSQVKIKVNQITESPTSRFKLAYWKPYGLVLEGQLQSKRKFENKNTVKKMIEVVNASGKIVYSVDAQNTDWYEKGNFNGYQAILSFSKCFGLLENGDYCVKLHVKTDDQQDYTVPIKEDNGLRSYIKEMDKIGTKLIGSNLCQFETKNGELCFKIQNEHEQDYSFFKSAYWESYGLILNGLAGKANEVYPAKDSVNKVLEIVDSNGNIIEKIPAVNTAYSKGTFDGYQAIISSKKVLTKLKEGKYTFSIKVTTKKGEEIHLPVRIASEQTNPQILYRKIHPVTDIKELPMKKIGAKQVKFTNVQNQLQMDLAQTKNNFESISNKYKK